jgi:hypothetical protein
VFNVLTLVSRIAGTFQTPILTKLVEHNSSESNMINTFNLIIIVSGIATIFAAVLLPTFQRIFYKGVLSFSVHKSISKLIMYSFSRAGISCMKHSIAVPVKENITKVNIKKLPKRITVYNFVAVSFITTGTLAPIYAGIIVPDFRATCITLSSVINGIATILASIYIDPALSVMTDDVIDNKCSEEDFRTCIMALVGSKILGTFAALLLFIPSTYVIVYIARII